MAALRASALLIIVMLLLVWMIRREGVDVQNRIMVAFLCRF
jgi:hypothetical protein